MSRRIRLYNIEWDVDFDSPDEDGNPPPLGLPVDLVVEVGRRFDPVEDSAELLSEMFGYTTLGSCWEQVE